MTKARILADYVAGGTTAAEFDYMDGVTSNVQTQLNAKAPLASPAITGGMTVDGATVFNEASADVDFRVESNGNANMLVVDASTDRVGIGTAAPDYVLEVVTGGGNPPPTDGSFNGVMRLQTSAGGENALDFGLKHASPTGAWIQSQASATDGSKHNLLLNPNGGNVGIGTTSPDGKLSVVHASTTSITNAFGLYSTMNITAGTVTNAYGAYITANSSSSPTISDSLI